MILPAKKVKLLLEVPGHFVETAKQFPANVDQALALLDQEEDVKQLLDQADTLEFYAKRVRMDTDIVNHIQYGRLKIVAKLGELMPTEQGKRTDKQLTKAGLGSSFSAPTKAAYRKVSDHAPKIDEYFARAQEETEKSKSGEGEPVEMSTAGFLRFVGSDGNLKSHQNQGVIEWYTPMEYIEACRETMGGIDLDPASCKRANRVVKAEAIYTKEDSGLGKDWKGRVFLNPPFKADLAKAFVGKLCQHYRAGDVPQAILLTNNNTDTQWWHQAAATCTAICFTSGRIPFYNPVGETASPTNGHTLFYFGHEHERFTRRFVSFGTIMGLVAPAE